MNCIIVILTVITFTTGVPRTNRIWGGQNATSGQFPYMVAINDQSQICGGVIIAPSWIVTAAQCLFYISPTTSIYVGSHLNLVNGTAHRITDTIVHEGYDDWTHQNDIGLIKLNTPLDFSDKIQAIELGDVVAPSTICTVIGWGASQDDIFPENLQYLELATLDMDLCQIMTDGQLLDAYLGPEQICTLAPEDQGACFGDYGGPLVCDGKFAGIASYTATYMCAVHMPDVYTSISAYLDWILTVIQP